MFLKNGLIYLLILSIKCKLLRYIFYTQALLSAIPRLEDDRPNYIRLQGEVPTPVNLPSGCVFHGRCPYANERCRQEIPRLIVTDGGSQVACHAVEEGRL